jgi:hypothetical protein
MNRSSRTILLVLLGSPLLLSGCSNDDDGSNAPGQRSTHYRGGSGFHFFGGSGGSGGRSGGSAVHSASPRGGFGGFGHFGGFGG